jgi:hypothetical protein
MEFVIGCGYYDICKPVMPWRSAEVSRTNPETLLSSTVGMVWWGSIGVLIPPTCDVRNAASSSFMADGITSNKMDLFLATCWLTQRSKRSCSRVLVTPY